MPTPGDLIQAVSDCFQVPEATVFQHDRMLVQAGFRQAGGRGRNSSVTPEDAANLVIAIVGAPPFGPTVKESGPTLKKYARLPAKAVDVYPTPGIWSRSMPNLKPGHSFASALGEIIRCFASGRFDHAINVWPELKQVMTPDLAERLASEEPDELPIGEFDPGTIDVAVTIAWPSPKAEIKILGRIGLPRPNAMEERLEYVSLPRANKIVRECDLHQIRNFSEDTLKIIASLFKDEIASKP